MCKVEKLVKSLYAKWRLTKWQKKKCNPANTAAIAHIFENYEIKSVLDIQEALKDMFGGAMEQMLAGELDSHLGYDRHENATQTTNRRNGASSKTVLSQL